MSISKKTDSDEADSKGINMPSDEGDADDNAPEPTIGKKANTAALEANSNGKTNDMVEQMKRLGEPVKTESEDEYLIYTGQKE